MKHLRPAALLLLLAACDCGTTLGGPCLSTADCNGDAICIDGECTPPDDTGGPCTTVADCDPGFLCIDMTCVRRDTEPGCEDLDGDGYGEGCSLGMDCDDTDPAQNGREVCDGLDNDCDGEADNGVLSPCGNCDPLCRADGFGPPDGMPWDIGDDSEDESDGVGVDDDGALVLDSRRINTNFIWVANTTEGSVSRFSTTAPYPEVGRYFTGAVVNAGAYFAGNDPSRTSVNSRGDAFVGNRNGNELTRISVLGTDCPDSNGDGVVTTSQDLNGDGIISTNLADGEMLAWGEDDCILWHKNLDDALPGENLIRAVAAQDVDGLDGALLEYVWVGGHRTQTVSKLDGETGDVILTVPSPVPTYGFALDGSGQLWISGNGDTAIGRVDTTRCIDDASCVADAICDAGTPENDGCDGAIRARIPMSHFPYGITVDFNQRVWTGGRSGGNTAMYSRYDPAAPSGSRWVSVSQGTPGWLHGIAADANGFIWGALQQSGIVRIDADDPNTRLIVPGTPGPTNKGMAIDAEGKIWCITQNNYAVVITPGMAIDANTVETNVAASMRGNYTYSDMTGLQLRLATNPRGFYRHIFEACPDGGVPSWTDVVFDASVPPGTTLSFRVKTADTRDGLALAEWVAVGSVPPPADRFSIGDALMAAGITPQRFLMLEIALQADRVSSTEVITPRVMSTDVTHTCEPIIE
ncbi:MAG: hypothetical protein JJ863_07030 [Deltaproteobacteria bacterium]|nr:hypothetical protein [Deltaproteobacteria bacterium]